MRFSPGSPAGFTMSPSGDAWTEFTRGMSPQEYREFGAFVDRVDPNAGTDRDRLEALRMTWAASTGVYPRQEGWPRTPATGPRGDRRQADDCPPLWFRLVLASIFAGCLIGAWTKPPLIAVGMGGRQAGEWTPEAYALSAVGVGLLIVWIIFFWKD